MIFHACAIPGRHCFPQAKACANSGCHRAHPVHPPYGTHAQTCHRWLQVLRQTHVKMRFCQSPELGSCGYSVRGRCRQKGRGMRISVTIFQSTRIVHTFHCRLHLTASRCERSEQLPDGLRAFAGWGGACCCRNQRGAILRPYQ